MSSFDRLMRVTAEGHEQPFFLRLGANDQTVLQGSSTTAYASFDDLRANQNTTKIVVKEVLAPVFDDRLPIYCVGLNYHSHAKEANLKVPKLPPVWTKPAAALAHPDAQIVLDDQTAKSLPDYEGELVFITSRVVKNITPAEAQSAILGYTVGNDLSCRLFQLQDYQAGQFYYAKAFDDFAPIGSVLVSPEVYEQSSKVLVTKVNGKVVQNAQVNEDMVFEPARILSHMSQGTTIPAYTVVMTGTPAGVGAFQKPKTFLQDGDRVEVSMDGVAVLQNTIKFKIEWLTGSKI